jgi:diacylglycerol kinase (ATP)
MLNQLKKTKKICLIANPISGQRRKHRCLGEIVQAIRSAGYSVQELPTQRPGHATQLAASVPDDTAAVLVFGGDGTVREVAAGLMNRRIPLCHLPAGNENLFARQFAMTTKTAGVLATLQSGTVETIDLVDVNGLVCVSCIGIGIDGEITRRVVAKRRGHVSNLDYVRPIASCFFVGYKFPHLQVIADGKSVFAGCGSFCAGNLNEYAARLPLFKAACPSDGLLDIVILPCRNKWDLFKLLPSILAGWHDKNKSIICLRAKEVIIQAEGGTACQLDGDVGPNPPITARMLPAALDVLVPPK